MNSRKTVRFAPQIVALVILGWVATSVVEAAADGKGSVSGRVLGLDDKPVAGLALRLERFQPIGMDDPTGGRKKSTISGSGSQGMGQGGVKVLGRTTTDQNGNFMFTNIEAGGATLVGGSQKVGWIYQDVVIEPNKETKLGDLKLAKTD